MRWEVFCILAPVILYVLLRIAMPWKSERRNPPTIDHNVYIVPTRDNKVSLYRYGNKIGKRDMNAKDLQFAIKQARARRDKKSVALFEEALTYIDQKGN